MDYKIQRKGERWSFENDNLFHGLAAQITHSLFLFKPCNAVCIVVCSFCTIPLPLPQRLTHYDGLADVSDGEVQHLLLRPLASSSPPRHCCRRPCHHCRDSTLFFDIGSGRIFNHRFVESCIDCQTICKSINSKFDLCYNGCILDFEAISHSKAFPFQRILLAIYIWFCISDARGNFITSWRDLKDRAGSFCIWRSKRSGGRGGKDETPPGEKEQSCKKRFK